MDDEKQLLDIISEKEEILRRDFEIVIRKSEEQISRSREKASEILNLAETEGKIAADEYYRQEMEKLKTDICEIRSSGIEEAEQIRVRGTARLSSAVSKIISFVTG